MPKIPTFESQGRPTAEVGGIKTSFQVPVTNDIFTKAQSLVANYYIKEREEEAKIKSLDYENKLLPKLYDAFDKHSKNPFPSEASSSFLKEGKETIQSIIDNELANENNFVKKRFLEKGNASLSSINLATLKQSRLLMESEKNKVSNNWKSGLFTEMQIGAIDVDFAKQKAADWVNTNISDPDSNTSVNKKKFELDNIYKSIETLAMQKDSRTDDNFLNKLKENPSLYPLVDLEDRNKFISYAQTIAGKRSEENFTNAIKAEVKETPFGQQADTVSSLLPIIKQRYPDQETQTKAINVAQKALDEKRKTIIEQGAGEYFINLDQKLNQDYLQSLQDPNQFSVFKKSLDAKYDQQRIPDEYRTYLPNNKIQEIGDLIKGTKDVKQKQKVVKDLKAFYGDAMPYIVKQIDQKIGPNVALALSTNDIDLQNLSLLGELKDEEKKIVRAKVDNQNAETELIKVINKNIQPLADIIANQPDGYATYSQSIGKYVTTIKDSAMRGIYEGKYADVSDASNKLSLGFMADYDTTNDTFYVPFDVNGKLVNLGVIEAKTQIFKTKLYFNDINLDDFDVDLVGRGGSLLSKKESIDFFKKNGEWYMDGNTGIKFGVKGASGTFTPMKVNKENVRINFTDYDGKFESMKDKNGNSFVIPMDQIYSFESIRAMNLKPYTP
jgi:disulfide oxidoreductase YuzD